MVSLILQVLGNSDIYVDNNWGIHTLSPSYTLEDILDKAECNKDLLLEINRVDFPIIRRILESPLVTEASEDSSGPLWCFVLTDQRQWQSQRNDSEGWNVVAADGIWWQDILGKWCEDHNIPCYFLPLEIDAAVANGAADWEGMAQKIEQVFTKLITVDEKNQLYFHPQEGEPSPIDKITVQHSSGTPALSGALYLWGIEGKLAGLPIDFVYVSEQELECEPHSGIHWQWHLKVPQIRELLKIQDFSGALQILKSHHHATTTALTPSAAAIPLKNYAKLVDDLEQLDRAVSLNLTGRTGLTGREGIIERVAIALWSEQAFRERSQWMHWYLRVAGAFELVIFLLVEKQGKGKYEWRGIKFMDPSQRLEINRAPISQIMQCLNGTKSELELFGNSYPFPLDSMALQPNWSQFEQFYVRTNAQQDGWTLTAVPQGNCLGFTQIRNKLYHSLLGDIIDKELNQRTLDLGKFDRPEHPAQVAVNWLNYIISLAGLTEEVQNRADTYRQLVGEIEENL
ncbi:hypothetical protein [Laspinema olomoucense]|uniref:Uncharacterized protein n=1 Tax=Laspinema olomoucense D3b TaxID=2953688 RepID=A0ABT2N8M9_9CYAN|nr:hypothetical protein [Laspinema sp. D3b]MCT7977601.1 hypothetical protein [Laspinema sp. D3b]